MHYFFATRGMKWHRDRMVEQLASLCVPYTIKDKKGKVLNEAVQVLLQPIELWSLVFPKENLDKILRTVGVSNHVGNKLGKGKKKFEAPEMKLPLAMLRKTLKLKKCPEVEPGPRFPVIMDNVQTVSLGIKEDYENEWGNECL